MPSIQPSSIQPSPSASEVSSIQLKVPLGTVLEPPITDSRVTDAGSRIAAPSGRRVWCWIGLTLAAVGLGIAIIRYRAVGLGVSVGGIIVAIVFWRPAVVPPVDPQVVPADKQVVHSELPKVNRWEKGPIPDLATFQQRINSPNKFYRLQAVRRALVFGDAAIPYLLDAMGDGSADVGFLDKSTIMTASAFVMPTLLQYSVDASKPIRQKFACDILADNTIAAFYDVPSTQVLIKYRQHENEHIRFRIKRALDSRYRTLGDQPDLTNDLIQGRLNRTEYVKAVAQRELPKLFEIATNYSNFTDAYGEPADALEKIAAFGPAASHRLDDLKIIHKYLIQSDYRFRNSFGKTNYIIHETSLFSKSTLAIARCGIDGWNYLIESLNHVKEKREARRCIIENIARHCPDESYHPQLATVLHEALKSTSDDEERQELTTLLAQIGDRKSLEQALTMPNAHLVEEGILYYKSEKGINSLVSNASRQIRHAHATKANVFKGVHLLARHPNAFPDCDELLAIVKPTHPMWFLQPHSR